MVDNTERGIILDGFRSIMAGLDRVVYNLLSVIYEIFFNVATANIISGQTVKTFYSRVQLILGVVIMFKVAISLFNGIMNPDSLNDGKNGFSSIIKRVVMVLIMFVLMVPLNIPNAGNSDDYTSNSQSSWNARMNENGILFGTLYEVQSRLLSQNIVSKLILGTDYSASNDEDDDPNSVSNFANDTLHLNVNETEYEKAARQLSSIVLRCFVTINLESEYGDPAEDDDRMCKESDLENYDKSYDVYEDDDSTASEILAEINQKCDIQTGLGGERYAYNYLFGFSTIVGILFVIIIVSFTVDAAIRVFKLAILRLIAPIPIISYIDPKTESTFQNWVKILGKTFADLFVRLAIINFVIFFIREFGTNGLGVTVVGNGLVGVFSKIFIYLGLLMFAKEAPKFIADSLGIKDSGKFKLFSGFSSLAGLGATAAAGISSYRSGKAASIDADRENQNNDMSLGNRIKHVGAGLAAAVSGARMAGSAYSKAENNRWRSSLDQVNRANAMRRANGADGGTWWGAEKAQLAQDFTGDSEYDSTKRYIKSLEDEGKKFNKSKAAFDRKKSLLSAMQGVGKGVISSASDEVQKKGAYFDLTSKSYQAIDSNGNKFSISGMTGDLKGIKSALSVGESTGVYKYGGYEFDAATLNKMYADALDNAVDSYVSGTAKMGDGVTDLNQSATFKAQLTNAMSDYREAGYNLNIDSLRSDLKGVNDSIGAQIEAQNVQINRLEQQIYDNNLEQQRAKDSLEKLSADMRGTDGSRGGK